ncbi:MAG TPA: patatin-like phospholipase family protein [Chryseosolibacter sp.]
MADKKVHLVLGSGGARGIAHIGVIEALEETGHQIISVTGCSMGAVVGGIYAAGFQRDYKEWLIKLTKPQVFRLLDFTLSGQGFLKGERVFSVLQALTGPQNIEKFKIPFTAVAADMVNDKEVHYREGDLYKALRASIAIPGIFTPVVQNGQFLVDGGVLNPLPLNLVTKKQGELVVAVNLSGRPTVPRVAQDDAEETQAVLKWLSSIMRYAGTKEKELLPTAEYSLRELLVSSYRMTQDRLTNLMLIAYPPDILIEVPRNVCSTFEFFKAKTLLELGRELGYQALSAREANTMARR